MARKPDTQKSEESPKLPDNVKQPDFVQEIERQIGPLVNQSQKEMIISRVVMAVQASEQFSGPIAHPRHLREYEDILSGAANRIITMAENEQNHNREMEKKIVDAQIHDQGRGMRYGMAALGLDLGLATFSGLYGQNNVLAGLLLGAGVLGVVGSFIRGRYAPEKTSKDDK